MLNHWHPAFVGMQEPFSGQMMHLGSLLEYDHGVVGYEGNGHNALDRADTRRFNDFQTCILYNRNILHLVESDHLWLSETPRKKSKSWDSWGIRTLTIGRFLWKAMDKMVIVFNTHLDVSGERARREGAAIVAAKVREWSQRWPAALIFVTGDFNSANSQAPHQILTSPNTGLQDVWSVCETLGNESCALYGVSSTFHGWFGALTNSYAVRIGQYLALGVHGGGMPLHGIERTFAGVTSRLLQLDVLRIFAAFPETLSRMHVDWILFKHEGSGCEPRAVAVGEVRNTNFSSDHFPVAALIQCK